jgi:ribosome modulation factor
MKLSRAALLLVTAACLFATGCASHPYYAVAPAPYASAPPLIERAEHQGFRAGSEAGSRDLYNNFGHHPERDRSYHDTPGYDPAMGPYGPYRDAFRRAYVRGYDQAFYRR